MTFHTKQIIRSPLLSQHKFLCAVRCWIWLGYMIQSLKKANRLLLAQTPLPATVDDFLLLVTQERCSCIVNMDPEHTENKVM